MTTDAQETKPRKRLFSPLDIQEEGGPTPTRQAKLRMRGDFCPHVKICGRVYYLAEDWENYLRSQRRSSTQATAA